MAEYLCKPLNQGELLVAHKGQQPKSFTCFDHQGLRFWVDVADLPGETAGKSTDAANVEAAKAGDTIGLGPMLRKHMENVDYSNKRSMDRLKSQIAEHEIALDELREAMSESIKLQAEIEAALKL